MRRRVLSLLTFAAAAGCTEGLVAEHVHPRRLHHKKGLAQVGQTQPAAAPVAHDVAFSTRRVHWRRRPRTLDDGPVTTEAGRLQNVLDVASVAEDFETRAKPPFVSIPGQEAEDRLTPQQREGVEGIFDQSPDDFRDCVLVHQYAEPLEVIDSYEMEHHSFAELVRVEDDGDNATGGSAGGAKNATVPILVRPGAVYDSATADGSQLHVGTSMLAKLEGMSNPVQVIPHGPISLWSSKQRVPIAGFLCMEKDKGDSAPVLHSTPTPCVPTTLDAEGNELDPFLDPYEVFIGSTRVAFQNKVQAERFCLAYAEEIAKDLGTLVWDAEDLKGAMPEPQAVQAQTLAKGDTCYRFCEDGSQPPIDLKSRCPVDAPCTSPLPAGMASYDTCSNRAYTCGGVVVEGGSGGAPAPAPASAVALPPNEAQALLMAEVEDGAGPAESPQHWGGGDGSDVFLETRASSERLTPGDLRHRRSLLHRGARRHLQQRRGRRLSPPIRLAERRLWMASGGHMDNIAFHGDRLGQGIRSMATIRDPDLLSFVAGSRKRPTPEGWTLGTKRLLVLIMDWKAGDQTLAPYSQQDADALPHYRDTVFPEVQRRFADMSYGQFQLDVTLVPEVVRYTRNRNQMSGRLPFPTLYNEARGALQSHPTFGHQFAFRDFDLVYVIVPQVNPVGTKGVAWVGSRGAVCNGCETISDNFKIMVAVHELGHNLGLSHASSEALEYGNPFDWMGNYPDVVGLHYGMGYKRDLNWIPAETVMDVTDSSVDSLNDMVTIAPYDVLQMPQSGQVAGVRISLRENSEDIYVSYRSTLKNDLKGVFIVYQNKDNPNSKLMDAACHSPSQQDAHLREGWTYMDGSHKVVIKVVSVSADSAKVHLYRTPKVAHSVAGIRARSLFTDGVSKCPRTCQDSDLIISRTCADLRDQGYCTGSIRLQGKKLSIGTEVCPKTCGKCQDVLAEPPQVGAKGRCDDSNVVISGMDCPAIARKDMCDMKTTSGKKLGQDLCRKSCALCPKPPPASRPGSAGNFPDPAPARAAGGGDGAVGGACPAGCREAQCRSGTAGNGGVPMSGSTCTARCSKQFGDARFCGRGGEYDSDGSLDCSACSDVQAGMASKYVCPSTCMAPTCSHGSPNNGGWHLTGDRCTGRCSKAFGELRYCGSGGVYAGAGSVDCTACGPAQIASAADVAANGSCEDDATWTDPDGNDCETYRATIEAWGKDKVCKKYKNGVGGLHCRATCGTCKAESHAVRPSGCADNACIGPWLEAYGRCFQCGDYLMGCTDPKYKAVFRTECPLTCGVCEPKSPTARAEAASAAGNASSPVDAKKHEGKKADKPKTCKDEDHTFCKSLGKNYCAEGSFKERCRATCDMCPPVGSESATQASSCMDRFSSYTCQRYESYGWCTRKDTRDTVQLNCPMTCGVCGDWSPLPTQTPAASKKGGERSAAGGRWAMAPAIAAVALAVALAAATC